MRRPQLGWPLLPVPDEAGRLHYPREADESVRQSIRIILTTRPGELLLHPDFGAGLDELLDEPDSLSLRREIRDRVTSHLAQWEPRISVDRVNVDAVDGEPSQLRVEITYRLRRTGAPASLGLTLVTGA